MSGSDVILEGYGLSTAEVGEVVDGIQLRREDVMVNPRELAAVELRFLNRTFVLLEYAFAIILLCGI
jgi:hypothetical protein